MPKRSAMKQGAIITINILKEEEGSPLPADLHYRHHLDYSLMLIRMGRSPGKIEDNGTGLIYEGHDIPHRKTSFTHRIIDQPMHQPAGGLTQNGLFFRAAKDYLHGRTSPEDVKVYEELAPGNWVYIGMFQLIDAWREDLDNRRIFKFKLRLQPVEGEETMAIIPAGLKLGAWKRSQGQCEKCRSTKNLHLIAEILPGEASLTPGRVKVLCEQHRRLISLFKK